MSLSTSNHQSSLFICGTDTDVGKTVISAWLTLHWQASYWKPIQSGLEQGSDSERIHQLSQTHCYPETWRLRAALSPHQAALLEGISIDLQHVHLPTASRLIIEGAGGLLTPLNHHQSIADLIAHLNTPTILVARSRLGTINHTCLTIEALRARRLNLLGVIMVGDINHSNRTAIEHYGQTSVLAEFPWLENLNREHLANIPLPPALSHTLTQLATPTL